MKQFLYAILLASLITSCQKSDQTESKQKTNSAGLKVDEYYLPKLDPAEPLEVARQHLANMLVANTDTTKHPHSIDGEGNLKTVPGRSWTSGFFSGNLWLMYEHTQDTFWKAQAERWTANLEPQKHNANTHDLGFMMYCSYGNALRLTSDRKRHYIEVLLRTAQTLAIRYNPKVGCIRSWDWSPKDKQWQYPVIVDNMMNLELLLWAARASGDTTYRNMSISHADKTLENHYRQDNSSWHVVDYAPENGNINWKGTYQGLSDSSAWARGQAWGLYGYTLMYRETLNEKYLDHAKAIARFILKHPNLPEDMVPYWDFDASAGSDQPRDASAAAIIASALLELNQYEWDEGYFKKAESILLSLSSPEYLAAPGTNGNFILKHSTGSKPHEAEVDVPLVYADYYFLEALLRYKKYLAK